MIRATVVLHETAFCESGKTYGGPFLTIKSENITRYSDNRFAADLTLNFPVDASPELVRRANDAINAAIQSASKKEAA